MFTRKLGKSNIEISAMGLGCWAIGGPFWEGDTPLGWGEVDDAESTRAIHRAIDMGVNFFDTADVYGAGHSERVLAQALAGKRQQVVIATKFGYTFDESTHQTAAPSADPTYIRKACEASLERLNTDYIDLYQFHINDYPIEDASAVCDTLEDLVTQGKIRYYGWSTDFSNRAHFFAQGQHCTAIQVEMNVLDDAPEIIAICETFNLAAINRGPLAMGLLTGKYTGKTKPTTDDVRGEKSPDWMKYFKDGHPSPEGLQKLETIRTILMSNGRTLAQGALAWLWARNENTIPIPGFRTIKQVEENIKAMQYGPLTPSQVEEINTLIRAT